MIAISSVGLLVGGVGVMNIMLVSVTERTREIGVRKALGARRRDILWQFLTEAMTLTGVGGVLGILSAAGAACLITSSRPSPRHRDRSGRSSRSASRGLGLAFGLWPAARPPASTPSKPSATSDGQRPGRC